MPYCYSYARPALTVDCVVFGLDHDEGLKILLIQRGGQPFRGSWALPGGFVDVGEDIQDAALRELGEETGLGKISLEQIGAFGKPNRDPREHVVSVAYYSLVNLQRHRPKAASDARAADWFALSALPPLAFDHCDILQAAQRLLRTKIRSQPFGLDLLPSKFTLSQLQMLYEQLLERPFDKRNFRRKIASMQLLVELNTVEKKVSHRAARLYRFDKKKYRELSRKGLPLHF